MINSYSKEISKKEWQKIADSFNENCFWTMPVEIERRVADGSG